jgi:hypothetical protein
MMNIKRALSELRGVLGGYGFAQPKTESTKGAYPFGDKEKQYRAYSDAELAYARTDASDAAKNMKGHDPEAENWYRDDVSTIDQEIQRRRGKKTKTEASTKVGDRATITGGNKKYVGKQGTISGVTGSEQPFHWQIKLDDGPEGVWKGDEFDSSTKTEDDTSLADTADLHKEMSDYLVDRFKGMVDDEKSAEFDREAAIYWLANDWHDGQSDPLYAVLSQSKYNPGPSHSEVDDEGEMVTKMYHALVNKFGPPKLRRWTPMQKKAKAEARAPSAYGSMSSGRYIGQVLGNVISDIEKGHHEDAVTLLRKLKTDLEKAGTEVIELWGEGK